MGDIGLTGMFGSLTTGTIAVGAFILFLWLFDRNHLGPVGYSRGLVSGETLGNWNPLGVIILVTLGLLLEDMTDKWTDGSSSTISSLPRYVLPAEDTLRSNVFWKPDGSPTSLAINVCENNPAVTEITGLHLKAIQSLPLNTKNSKTQEIYYAAKNWCFNQPTYFSELSFIQQRIDLSRTIAMIGFTAIAAMALMTMCECCYYVFGRRRRAWPRWPLLRFLIRNNQLTSPYDLQSIHNPAPCPTSEITDDNRQIRSGQSFNDEKFAALHPYSVKWWRRYISVAALYVFLFTSGRVGYTHSEEVFNERVFGYFGTAQTAFFAGRPGSISPVVSAVRWFRKSSEYAATCRNVYGFAANRVREIDSTPSRNDRNNAVVLDLDETVLDNSEFNEMLVKTGRVYEEKLWQAWVLSSSEHVRLVPGFSEFMQSVPDHVEFVFISNRDQILRAVTIETLERLGVERRLTTQLDAEEKAAYWSDHLFLKQGDQSSKVERRDLVSQRFNVIAFIGDAIDDFPGRWNTNGLQLPHSRTAIEMEPRFWQGADFFCLPNPMYGSWDRL